MKNILVIFGPTGVGKTKLSIELAQKLNGEIISADSMQIYKNMNIGTAKATKEEMQNIPHHMLDIVSPNEEYSVGQYVVETKKIISDIFSRNKTPIIVGGTGLYINSLINEYDFCQAPKNEIIREKYKKLEEEKGKKFVYDLLIKQDPIRASQLHPNDIKRVVRALEIIEINREKNNKNFKIEDGDATKNEEKIAKNTQNEFNYIVFGINMDREKLYNNINIRVEKMFANGLVKEVKSLLNNGIDKNSQAMQGIGYKEIIEGLEKNQSIEEIKEEIKKRTRNYAKRQLTFMRGMKNLIWVEISENAKGDILEKIKEEL